MKLLVKKGTTSKRIFIFVLDSSKTDGSGLAGLTNASSGLKWYYAREDDGNAGGTSVTPASATLGTFTSSGFKEKDATNMPGVYELGIPNAALATGSDTVVMILRGVTNMAPVLVEIQLVNFDPADGAGLGLSRIDAAVSAVVALLPTALVGGKMDSHVNDIAASAITATAIASNALTAAKIATDAIGAAQLAADAVTEIQSGLATSSGQSTIISAVAAVQADTDDIQTRIPAALDGGFMKAQVKGMDAGTVTAAVIATDAIDADSLKADAATEIAAAVAAPSAATVASAVRTELAVELAHLDADVSSVGGGTPPTAIENADAYLDRAGAIDGKTPREAMRYIAASTCGKSSGDPGSPTFKGLDGLTDRLSAIVDGDGNRVDVELDP